MNAAHSPEARGCVWGWSLHGLSSSWLVYNLIENYLGYMKVAGTFKYSIAKHKIIEVKGQNLIFFQKQSTFIHPKITLSISIRIFSNFVNIVICVTGCFSVLFCWPIMGPRSQIWSQHGRIAIQNQYVHVLIHPAAMEISSSKIKLDF